MTEIDISDTIAPNSDQLDAVDLLGGPVTFTIEKTSKNSGEQPVSIKLVGFPRVYRPGKSMRRVLVGVWGKDASQYAGRRLTLFCDQGVKFGGVAVGGVRISHMSHIERQASVVLLESRGKSIIWKVDPLVEDPSVALNAAKQRVKAAAPADVDLRTWVPEQLKRLELDGATTDNLIKLAADLEAGQ